MATNDNQSSDFTFQAVIAPLASPRSRLVAGLLCFFFGLLGIHRFYVGKWGTGLIQLFTGGGFVIWAVIDLFLIIFGLFTDAEGRRL